MRLRQFALTLLATLAFCALIPAGPRQSTNSSQPDGFPLSVWATQRDVTQLPVYPWIGDSLIRFDLRHEFRISASGLVGRPETGAPSQDLVLYARFLERGQAVSPVHSVPGKEAIIAIVRPGRYRVELALLDRSTGQYSTRFHDVLVDGKESDPLERAFQQFPRVDFVPEQVPEKRDISRDLSISRSISQTRTNIAQPKILSGSAHGITTAQPSFVIDKPRPMHVSILTIVNPPDNAIHDDALRLDAFRGNLANLLSVFSRLDVKNGTAKFTGVDLIEGTRVVDRIDLREVTRDLLDGAMTTKDTTTTVTLEALAAQANRGGFFRDMLQERFEAAEKDSSEAEHVIIVVSAHNVFQNTRLTLAPARNCRCKVFYFRFPMIPKEDDDIDDLLKPYKPRVFSPLTWKEFRQNFAAMYAELLR